jgi:hypothetical protein
VTFLVWVKVMSEVDFFCIAVSQFNQFLTVFSTCSIFSDIFRSKPW